MVHLLKVALDMEYQDGRRTFTHGRFTDCLLLQLLGHYWWQYDGDMCILWNQGGMLGS